MRGEKIGTIFKYIWCGINCFAVIIFFVLYLRVTCRFFSPPYERQNLLFIGLFLIFTEGIAESFISCIRNEAKSCQCWISLFIFSIAITVLYLTTYRLLESFKETFYTEEAITAALSLIFLLVEVIISPMLISKYSSWILLGISLTSKHDSKAELLLPVMLIVGNIVATVILNRFELSVKIIGYICVSGALSVISFIATIKRS